MLKFVLSVAIIAWGLAAGQLLRRKARSLPGGEGRAAAAVSVLQRTALLGINPLVTASAFWGLGSAARELAALPFLGLFALVTGGVLGLVLSAALRHSPKKMGAAFVSASFTNIGNFGGLICFVFFGEGSYVYVSLYKLFEEAYYYLVGYPAAKWFGTRGDSSGSSRADGGKGFLANAMALVRDPYITAYAAAIALGLILRGLGIPRPAVFTQANALLIPLSSLFLVVSVGFRMRFSAVGAYRKECLGIAGIKFLAVPAAVTAAAALAGLRTPETEAAFRVVIVLSSMPPAFNSLIPPTIYGLDSDLANSCWLFCTAALALVIPALLYAVG